MNKHAKQMTAGIHAVATDAILESISDGVFTSEGI